MGEVSSVGGHVTLLFSIHSEPLLARNQGSKGAGLCLEHGVISTVKNLPQGDDEISSSQWMAGDSKKERNCISIY